LKINMLRFFSFTVARYLLDSYKNSKKHYTFVVVYDANFKPTFEQRKTGA